jgi:hypothetical protein
MLLYERKEAEALEILKRLPQQPGASLLIACLERRTDDVARMAPQAEAAALSFHDPESRFLQARDLALCDQRQAALRVLASAVESYCAVQQLDRNPPFANLRGEPQFKPVRAAAEACQKRFLDHRTQRAR